MKITKAQLNDISRLYAERKTQTEIAQITGLSLKTVNLHCQRLKAYKRAVAAPQPYIERFIDVSTVPTVDSIKTDIMLVYRASLAELHKRLPDMSINEIYQLSMNLLRELNGSANS